MRYFSYRTLFFLSFFLLFFIAVTLASALFKNESINLKRTIEFSEKITLPSEETVSRIRLWVPIPATDDYQTTEILNVESSTNYKISQDKEFGNRFFYFEWRAPIKKETLSVEVLYQISRREQRALDNTSTKNRNVENITPFLAQRGLERANETIVKIAQEKTDGLMNPIEKAKALYDYVISAMKYDKSGTGWGRGDSLYACEVGKGNCTDFHSFFIAICRAVQIPARFRMGFSLPQTASGEPSGSYHCWAEFYAAGLGWVPVDISEAWKNPEKRDYFFGNLDPDRVLLTTGREILLSPQQEENPLNFFSKPYVELDGMEVNNFKLERKFKNL